MCEALATSVPFFKSPRWLLSDLLGEVKPNGCLSLAIYFTFFLRVSDAIARFAEYTMRA